MLSNALEVKHWIGVLRIGGWDINAVDDNSEKLIKKMFNALDKIEAVGDDDRKELWFRIRRPTFDEFVSYHTDDDFQEDNVPTETLKSWYEEEYQDDMVWFPFCAVHHGSGQEEYFGIFLDNSYILGIGDPNTRGYQIDASEIIEWMNSQVLDVIKEAEAGVYNDMVAGSLPTKYRTGSILRKDFWDINPDLRRQFRSGLTDAEINRFTGCCMEEPSAGELIPRMTARIFYEACGICYDSVDYNTHKHLFFTETKEEQKRYGADFTPKEKYYMHADGRDDNLKAVPMDDPDAYLEWRSERGVYEMNGHHPWEIRTSGSISHSIHLIPYEDKDTSKWFFLLTGNAASSSYEIVKYFLALKNAGIPVVLGDAERIAARYLETDRIGIFPYNVLSFGRTDVGYYFGDRDIIDGINLNPDENGDDVAKKATWIPEKTVVLKNQ